MILGDFEVFAHDWLLCTYDMSTREERTIINDKAALEALYEQYKDDIWMFYNARYDVYILKAILCGFNPKLVNDYIITEGKNGATYSRLFNNIQLYHFDVKTTMESLKTLEGFMGSDIRETSVPFDIERKLTAAELGEVVKYCRHDVRETYKVFCTRIEEFTSHLELASAFNLGKAALCKTKAQISAMALGAERKNLAADECEYVIPNNIEISTYTHVVQWFKDMQRDMSMYQKKLTCDVAGVPHVFAWGGIHGAIPNYHGKGVFINVDVASYYPSMMLEYGYVSRAIRNPGVYADIYHKRLEYKKDKDKRQQPLKIVLNSTYGATKDKYNPLYDPKQANNICVTGQLLLLDLIEHVEASGCADVIQSNTDGVLFKLRGDVNKSYYKLDDICYEWEQRTRMNLEFDEFCEVWQKDVNNYVMIADDRSYKSKGAYVKKLSSLDNDLPIVNEALINYMVHNVPIEQTILGCNELIKFQKILKVSNKYLCAQHNNKRLSEKTFRVFASTNASDTTLYKIKLKNDVEVAEKFANCPDHCFIDNSSMHGRCVSGELDKDYYITLAYNRLSDFVGKEI